MKIEVNIDKKVAYLIVTFLIIILGALIVNAAFSTSRPWHPLDQISPDGGSTSLDDNSNGKIDPEDIEYLSSSEGVKILKQGPSPTAVSVNCGAGFIITKCTYGQGTSGSDATQNALFAFMGYDNFFTSQYQASTCDLNSFGSQISQTVAPFTSLGYNYVTLIAQCEKAAS